MSVGDLEKIIEEKEEMGVGENWLIEGWIEVELTCDEDCSIPTTLCGCGMVDEGVALALTWTICHNLVVNFVWIRKYIIG
jgi:hypothetical protein